MHFLFNFKYIFNFLIIIIIISRLKLKKNKIKILKQTKKNTFLNWFFNKEARKIDQIHQTLIDTLKWWRIAKIKIEPLRISCLSSICYVGNKWSKWSLMPIKYQSSKWSPRCVLLLTTLNSQSRLKRTMASPNILTNRICCFQLNLIWPCLLFLA